MADLTAFVPYYSGLKAYPQHYAIGTDKADNDSIYWKYRKLQTLVMTGFTLNLLLLLKSIPRMGS